MVAYWETTGGRTVKGQRCKICDKPLKASRTIGEICAQPFIDHYRDNHGVRLESNSRLGAWEVVEDESLSADRPGSVMNGILNSKKRRI